MYLLIYGRLKNKIKKIFAVKCSHVWLGISHMTVIWHSELFIDQQIKGPGNAIWLLCTNHIIEESPSLTSNTWTVIITRETLVVQDSQISRHNFVL